MPPQDNQAPSPDRSLARPICLVALVLYALMLAAQAAANVTIERSLLPLYMWAMLTMFAAAAFAELTGRYPLAMPVRFGKRTPPEP